MKRQVDRRYVFNRLDILEALSLLCNQRDIQRSPSDRFKNESVELTLTQSDISLYWQDIIEDK